MKPFLRLLLLLSVFASPMHAQFSDCTVVGRWGVRTEPRGVVADGGYVFVADGNGVTTYAAADPALPSVQSRLVTSSPSLAIAELAGQRLAVLTERELLIVTRDGAGKLRIDRSLETLGSRMAVFQESVAIASERTVTLFPDIDSGRALEIFASAAIDAVHLDARHLYIAENRGGIRIVARANGSDVGHVSVQALDLASSGDVLYAAAGGIGIFVVDISTPSAPKVLTLLEPAVADFRKVIVRGDTLFALTSDERLVGFSITDPKSPVLVSRTPFPAADLLFLSDRDVLGWGRFVTLAGATTSQPAPLRLFRDHAALAEWSDASVLHGVATDGRYAFITDAPDLRIIDLDAPSGPTEVASVHYGDASTEVRLEGSLLLVHGISNVHMIDVSTPTAPKYLGVYRALGAPPSGAAMAGPYLLEANKPTGFHVVDISDPANPRQITGLKNDGLGQVYGTVGIEGASYNLIAAGIKVVDLSTGVANVVHLLRANYAITDADIVPSTEARSRLLVLSDGETLRFFDLRDHLRPVETAAVDIGHGGEIAVDRHLVYVLSAEGKLTRVDVSDASRPVITNRWKGLRAATGVAARGRIVLSGRYEALVLEDPDNAGEAASPALSLMEAGGRRFVLVSGDASRYYDVEISRSAAGAVARTVKVRGGSSVPLFANESFARSRASSPCNSPWNPPVDLRSTRSPVRFSSSESRLLASSASTTVELGIVNETAEPREVTISGEEIGTVRFTAAASRTSLVSVTIDTSANGVRVIHLTAGEVRDEHRVRVTVAQRQPGGAFSAATEVIPGIGSTPGANGTRWKSDLTLHCSAAESCRPLVRYVSGDLREEVSFDMTAGETLTIADIVTTLFGKSSSTGHVALAGPGDLSAEAFTYNDGAGLRFGQRISVVDPATAGAETRHLIGIRNDSSVRTNLGFVSTTGENRVMDIRLVDARGVSLASRTFEVPAGADLLLPLATLFAEATDGSELALELENAAGVVIYASRIESSTGDAVFTLAEAASSAPVHALFDSVGKVELPTSTWTTELNLRNTSAAPARVDLTLFIANTDQRESASISIPAGATWSTGDAIAELFGSRSTSVIGALHVIADGLIVGWGRLFHTTGSGIYGQELPLRPLRSTTAAGRAETTAQSLFPLEESDAIRTNVGLHESKGESIRVELRLFDSSGTVISAEQIDLAPYSTLFLTGYAGREGWRGRDARLEIVPISGSGAVQAWGSRVDRSSGDARTIGAP